MVQHSSGLFSKLLNRIYYNFLGTEKMVIVCVAVVIMGVIFTLFCGFKKLREKNIKLPKSLVSSDLLSISDF